MNTKFSVELAEDSLQIDADKLTLGQLEFHVSGPSEPEVFCSRIQIRLPYQSGKSSSAALTDSNDFSAHGGIWSASQAPFDINSAGTEVQVEFYNDYGFQGSQSANLKLQKLPILPNDSGVEKRMVEIVVDLFEEDAEEPFQQESLRLSLKTRGRETFVNYFVATNYNPEGGETLTLEWSVSNPKEMVLYPRFLTDFDHGTIVKSPAALDAYTQPYLINSEKPILISGSVGSLQVELIKSTQLRLIADNQGGYGVSELTLYLNKLDIIYFGFADKLEQPVSVGARIVLNWILSFPSKQSIDRRLVLYAQEYDNDAKLLSLLPGSKPAPGETQATWSIDLPLSNTGQLTVHPQRPTVYNLMVRDGGKSRTSDQRLITKAPSNPMASISIHAGKQIPYGWLLCDGASYDEARFVQTFKQANDDLSDLIHLKKSFWALCDELGMKGDQVVLPDLRGLFVVGADKGEKGAYSYGATGGQDEVQLTEAQIPPHSHSGTTLPGGAHEHPTNLLEFKKEDIRKAFLKLYTSNYGETVEFKGGNHSHTFKTHAAGAGRTHENRPPYYAAYYIIRVLL